MALIQSSFGRQARSQLYNPARRHYMNGSPLTVISLFVGLAAAAARPLAVTIIPPLGLGMVRNGWVIRANGMLSRCQHNNKPAGLAALRQGWHVQ